MKKIQNKFTVLFIIHVILVGWLYISDDENISISDVKWITRGKDCVVHRSMKNVVKLNHYYLPWDLEEEIEKFVEYYNNERYHECIR